MGKEQAQDSRYKPRTVDVHDSPDAQEVDLVSITQAMRYTIGIDERRFTGISTQPHPDFPTIRIVTIQSEPKSAPQGPTDMKPGQGIFFL